MATMFIGDPETVRVNLNLMIMWPVIIYSQGAARHSVDEHVARNVLAGGENEVHLFMGA
jgi:hypothetical protein